MIIKIAELPKEIPWAIGPTGELIINTKCVNELEEAYLHALEEFYVKWGGDNVTIGEWEQSAEKEVIIWNLIPVS